MGTPTHNTRHGKQGGIDFLRQANHLINKTGIKINVAGYCFPIILNLTESSDSTFFQKFKKSKLPFTTFLVCQVTCKFLQQHSSRIGNGIYGMPDAIYQSGLIVNLLIQHAGKVSIDFVYIGPVLNIFL